MTQQYLAGELSVLLGELRAAATNQNRRCEIDRLRRETEEFPTAVLGCVTTRALAVARALCWGSVTRGDTTAFHRQAAVSAQLYEFGICSGLLAEDYQPSTPPAGGVSSSHTDLFRSRGCVSDVYTLANRGQLGEEDD